MKNTEKISSKNLVAISLVALVLMVAVGVTSTVKAQVSSVSKENLVMRALNFLLDSEGAAEVEDNSFGLSFGGANFNEPQNDIATSTLDLQAEGSISIHDRLRFGDDPLVNNNSVTKKFLFKDFADATTTIFAIENQEGKNIYVQRIGLELTGLATTTMQFFVGTSSVDHVTPDDATIAAIANPGAGNAADYLTGLMDDVLVTDLSALDATGTILLSDVVEYAPVDLGHGTRIEGVPVSPGSFILGYASTTDPDGAQTNYGISGTDNLFDGKVYIEYLIFE